MRKPPLPNRRTLAVALVVAGVLGLGVASASRLLVEGGTHVSSGVAAVEPGCRAAVRAGYATGDLRADGSLPVTAVTLDGLDGCPAGRVVVATLFDADDRPLAETDRFVTDGSGSRVTLHLATGSPEVTNHDVARIGVVVR